MRITMTHQLGSIAAHRTRAILVAAVGITALLLAGPAAAGCSALDELPPVGVPEAPEVSEVSVDEVVHWPARASA